MKEKIIKYGKYFLIIIGVGIFIAVVIINSLNDGSEVLEDTVVEIEQETVNEKVIEPKEIRVDIKGEINNPGVYKLKEGDRVSDVIKVSGGLTENADTSLINLSKNLKDEMVIIIYNKYEIERLKQDMITSKTVVEYIEKECSCPDTINEACIKPKKESVKETSKGEKSDKIEDNGKVSINNGTLDDFKSLPGIGDSKAQAIIKYREENGSFNSIDELTNIKGIGTSIFEKFKDYITL